MIRKILLLITICLLITNPSTVLADDKNASETCTPNVDRCVDSGYDCLFDDAAKEYLCQKNPFGAIFGKVQPPDALKGLVAKDPTGAGGISQFLSSLIALIYSLAAIALIFMLIWGAFDWITSEGDKEKLQAAQRKIINAIIGIILFGVAFAVIQVLGHFTGFTFFVGQKP